VEFEMIYLVGIIEKQNEARKRRELYQRQRHTQEKPINLIYDDKNEMKYK
jgi:hypothetical protein